MAKATLNEMEIKQLVQNEIKACFEDISSDVKEIKMALLGDGKYQKTGLVAKVESHEEYIERNKTLKIIERAEPALKQYEDWSDKKMWEKTEKIVDNGAKWGWLKKLFLAMGSVGGTIIVIYNVILIIKNGI